MVDRIFDTLIQEAAQFLHRLTPGYSASFTSQKLLEVDDNSSDAHAAQVSDCLSLLVQSERTELHHLPL